MVNESTVKTFLTLARVGKFTEAARQLYLSQQAVSKQMAKLEQDLNCTLFNRERGHLTLTPAGKIYYEAFSKMDEIITAARKDADRLGGIWESTLSIGMPELLEIKQNTRALTRAFRAAYPQIRVTFKSAPHWTMLEWLADGTVDVAFTFDHETRNLDTLNTIPVVTQHEMLVVSSDDPRATPEANYLDFRNDPVFFTPDPNAEEEGQRQKLREIGFPGDNLVPTENMLSSVASVEQMEGVMFLLENCRLVRGTAFCTYPTPAYSTIVLAWRKDLKKRCALNFVAGAKKQLEEAEQQN